MPSPTDTSIVEPIDLLASQVIPGPATNPQLRPWKASGVLCISSLCDLSFPAGSSGPDSPSILTGLFQSHTFSFRQQF